MHAPCVDSSKNIMTPRSLLLISTLFSALGLAARAADEMPAPNPPRPHILGISHAAFYVSDMAKARAFYEGFLGFASPFSIPRKDPTQQLVWIKINDHQTIELFPGSEVAADAPRLYHIALEVDDAEAMRVYLQSKGVTVPAKVGVGKIGNKNYFIKDPNGNTVEIVEYLADGWTMREKGKFLPDTRVSVHMPHVGIMVGQLDASLKFYGDILGFRETWRGSKNSKVLNWVNLQVPDGKDYIEFMLYSGTPSLDRVHTMEHICLEVTDVAKTGEILKGRPLPEGCKPPTPIATGVNGKRQINYYDPDGTRVEVMEPVTADGKPVPPSTATPPAPEPPRNSGEKKAPAVSKT
jgi:catechol 2,3-dioxygenase-like lactoylglutathione lyase family enzyme